MEQAFVYFKKKQNWSKNIPNFANFALGLSYFNLWEKLYLNFANFAYFKKKQN